MFYCFTNNDVISQVRRKLELKFEFSFFNKFTKHIFKRHTNRSSLPTRASLESRLDQMNPGARRYSNRSLSDHDLTQPLNTNGQTSAAMHHQNRMPTSMNNYNTSSQNFTPGNVSSIYHKVRNRSDSSTTNISKSTTYNNLNNYQITRLSSDQNPISIRSSHEQVQYSSQTNFTNTTESEYKSIYSSIPPKFRGNNLSIKGKEVRF